ncbi:hypothetical protein FB446DRAFT_655506 [Lentinula raphanica]|nr:hypothetical protein FB446DRAFT_655506 [Lentinula raphanica]
MEAKGQVVSEKSVSDSWIRRFRIRHCQVVKTARGSGLDPKRAQVFNSHTVNAYFNELGKVLKEQEVPWENIYNMDEKGVQMGGGRKNSQRKYFFARKDNKMYHQHSDDLQLITIIDCICADGTAPISLAFVFPGLKMFKEWTEVRDDILYVRIFIFDKKLANKQ